MVILSTAVFYKMVNIYGYLMDRNLLLFILILVRRLQRGRLVLHYGWSSSVCPQIQVYFFNNSMIFFFSDFKARVTCVCELSPPLIENTMQLLIGLECDLIGGMICLFHCNGSKVLRAIQIDCQVISIQYIDSFPGSPLNCFDGGVLIGTHGGATLILDLNRQSCAESNISFDNSIYIYIYMNIFIY